MILYITGNEHKVISANKHLKQFGISTKGIKVDGIIEPQLDDITQISISKAKQAFEIVQKPLIVSDAGWMFTALNGFPGSYMASINKWFSPQDFLNLMKGKKNKEIILRECVTFTDGKLTKTFVCDSKGKVLKRAEGEGTSLDQIVTFRKDGNSIAKCLNEKKLGIPQNELWNEVGEWLKANVKK